MQSGAQEIVSVKHTVRVIAIILQFIIYFLVRYTIHDIIYVRLLVGIIILTSVPSLRQFYIRVRMYYKSERNTTETFTISAA